MQCLSIFGKPYFSETSGGRVRLRLLSQSIKQIFAHEDSQRDKESTFLAQIFFIRAVEVALPFCTPAESLNRTTIVEDYRYLTMNNAIGYRYFRSLVRF